jgi:hypothetical protein
MEFLAPMAVMITALLVFGAVLRAHFVNRRIRENTRLWAELQAKLIEKFGNAEDVVRYLESEGGRQVFEGQTSGSAAPHSRVLDSLHLGLIVLFGGIGLIAASGVSDANVHEVMQAVGLIGVVLGTGFLASAGISWALLKSWGLVGVREGSRESV